MTTPRAEPDPNLDEAPDRPNGLTDGQVAELLAVAGRSKGDPSMDRLMEEVEQYREILRKE